MLDCAKVEKPEVMLEFPSPGTALGVKTRRQPDGSYLVFLADGEAGLRFSALR